LLCLKSGACFWVPCAFLGAIPRLDHARVVLADLLNTGHLILCVDQRLSNKTRLDHAGVGGVLVVGVGDTHGDVWEEALAPLVQRAARHYRVARRRRSRRACTSEHDSSGNDFTNLRLRAAAEDCAYLLPVQNTSLKCCRVGLTAADH